MSAYFVIEPGTTRILIWEWSNSYPVMRQLSIKAGGVVTNHYWLKQRGVKLKREEILERGWCAGASQVRVIAGYRMVINGVAMPEVKGAPVEAEHAAVA